MKLERLTVAIAMLAGGACGSSGGGNTGGDIPADDFVAALDTVNCDLLVRCHLFSEEAFCPLYFGPTRAGFNSLSAIVAGVRAGTVDYDPAAARACIDALAAVECRALASGSAPAVAVCGQVFTGTLADGARCVSDGECVAGSFCAAPANGGCDGTCTRGGTLCNADEHCTGSQVCDESVPTPSSQGTCVTPTAAGAANQPCGTKQRCAAGLYCSGAGATPTCLPIAQEGGTCTGELDGCADGRFCALGSSGTATCLPPAAKGAPCQASGQCGALLSTMTCDETTGTCVDAPTSGACVGATLACNPLSSYCDLSSGTPTCTPYLATGAACSIFASACGLPGTALCVTTDPSTNSGTCAPPPAPAACVP